MLDLFRNAGVVAYPLALCSILGLGIVLERFYTLARLRRLEERAYLTLEGALLRGEYSAARESDIAGAPVATMVESLAPLRGASEETILHAADVALALQRLRLRRFLGTLATIGSTAPFIGLFGTVLGVMVAFEGMGRTGLSGEMMAAGISEALSATALGLLVAIPAIVAYNYFVGRVQALLLVIQGDITRLAPLIRGASSETRREAEKV